MSNEQTNGTNPVAEVPAVKTEVASPTKREKTTSQRIFPHLVGKEFPGSQILNEPAEGKKEEVKTDAVTPSEKPPTEKPVELTEYLDLSKFGKAKVKTKVDGVEEEISLEDIIRRVQTDKHITQKGQKIAETENAIRQRQMELDAREKVLAEFMLKEKPAPTKGESTENESFIKDDPYAKKLESELAALRAEFQAIRPTIQPMLYQQNVQRLSNEIKETMGMDDFMDYEPRIKAHIQSLPVEKQMEADTKQSWMNLYSMFKLQDMNKKLQEKPATAPVAAQRPITKVVPVESGSSVSNGVVNNDLEKRKALLERAKRLSIQGSDDKHQAWEDYLSFTGSTKGEI